MITNDRNTIVVFKENSHLLGIFPSEFDAYLRLNQMKISPEARNPLLWKFEVNDGTRQGWFIHPAMAFGFKDIRFSQTGFVFLKQHSKNQAVGLVMNHFIMQITAKKANRKTIDINEVKGIPANLPRSAFHSVHRYQRKTILVLNSEGLMNEYALNWEQLAD